MDGGKQENENLKSQGYWLIALDASLLDLNMRSGQRRVSAPFAPEAPVETRGLLCPWEMTPQVWTPAGLCLSLCLAMGLCCMGPALQTPEGPEQFQDTERKG